MKSRILALAALCFIAPYFFAATMSESTAMSLAKSYFGPSACLNQIKGTVDLSWTKQVGVCTTYGILPFTALGSGLSSWNAAFTNYNRRLTDGTFKVAGPFKGTVLMNLPYHDDVAMGSVRYYIDNVPFGEQLFANPPVQDWNPSFSLDTTMLTNGVHVICAKAWDAVSNTDIRSSSNALIFQVLN